MNILKTLSLITFLAGIHHNIIAENDLDSVIDFLQISKPKTILILEEIQLTSNYHLEGRQSIFPHGKNYNRNILMLSSDSLLWIKKRYSIGYKLTVKNKHSDTIATFLFDPYNGIASNIEYQDNEPVFISCFDAEGQVEFKFKKMEKGWVYSRRSDQWKEEDLYLFTLEMIDAMFLYDRLISSSWRKVIPIKIDSDR